MKPRCWGKPVVRLVTAILMLFILGGAGMPLRTAARSGREILRLGRGTANALDWRPDGKVLAVGAATGVWLYDENFEALGHFEGSGVQLVRWSPSGEELALADETGVHIRSIGSDGQSANVLFDFEDAGISSLAWSPDGSQFAAGSNRRTVTVWSVGNGEVIRSLPNIGYSVAWKPDGEQIGIAGEDGITIFDAATWTTLRRITNKQAAYNLTWSPDGQTLATDCHEDAQAGGFDASCFWDALTGTFIDSRDFAQTVWSPDGSEYLYYGSDGTQIVGSWIEVRKWPTRSLQARMDYDLLRQVIWHPNSQRLTGLTVDGMVVEWNAESGTIESRHGLHTSEIQTLSWSPDNLKIATTRGSQLSVWSLAKPQAGLVAEPLFALDTQEGAYGPGSVEIVRWNSPDELVSMEQPNGLLKRNATSGAINQYQDNLGVSDCFYSVSSSLDKAACRETNLEWNQLQVRIIDLQSGADLAIWSVLDAELMRWSPDGRVIALSSTIGPDTWMKMATHWEFRDVESGRVVFDYSTYNYRDLPKWSPDGKWIAAMIDDGQSQAVHIFGTDGYAEVAKTDPGDLYIWSSDSQILAVESPNGITFYEGQTGEVIKTIPMEGVVALAWSPDGTMLAVGMNDGTIRIWDVSDIGKAS